MALVEAIILRLGSSVAKALIKSLAGNASGEVLSELVGPVEEWGKDRLGRAAERRLEKLGQEVAERMRPALENKFGLLDAQRKQVVLAEAATTLAKAEISPDLIVKLNLDRERLRRHLLDSRPRATKGFSAEEVRLYELTLAEASRHVIEIATHLSGFAGAAYAEVLEGQDRLLSVVEKLAASGEEAARFEAGYRDAVKDQLDRMDLFGVRRVDQLQRRQSLSVSYIALQVERLAGEKETRESAPPGGDGTEPAEMRFDLRMLGELRSGPIDQMLTKSRRLVVRGEAGSGKTTLLRWVAVRSASRDFPSHLASWNTTVPFFIRLRECVRDGFPSPEELPRMVAPMLAGGMPHRWVHEQLESGRALLLVDGVDELPKEQREPARRRLAELVAAYPLARYVVSSRPSALKADEWPEWQEWVRGAGFMEVALQPMGPAQTESFIDHWHAAVRELIDPAEVPEFERRPANLKRLLRLRPALRKLATSPLLCAMICALHRERGDRLPSERITLYKDCCEMLLSLREGVRGIGLEGEYPDLSDPQKQALIQSFAYSLMLNGWSDVETAQADAHFSRRLEFMNLPGVNGAQVRNYFVERSSLLREPVAGRVDFTHRTFQEFLAAQEAVQNNDLGVLLKHAHDDQWRETIILAAGLARREECERLLRDLVKRANKLKTPARRNRMLLLALASLETPVQLDPAVRAHVLNKAAAVFPPKDESEAKMVAAAGDPAVQFLVRKAEHKEIVGAACVKALSLIGTNEALKAVETYANVTDWLVQEEVASAWDNFDRHEYALRVLSKSNRLNLPRFSSWEGFDHLTHLTELFLWKDFPFAEVSQLVMLPNLTYLFISDPADAVNDLTPLSVLRSVTELSLASGFEAVTDLHPLASLSSLRELSLYDFVSLTDLSPMSALHQLTDLYFNGCNAEDFNPLANLTNLEFLRFENCPELKDLRPLGRLKKLRHLTLINCEKVTDLSPLASLKELQVLDLQQTGVSDLSPLSQIKNLRVNHDGKIVEF
jgi:hypothetical protein